MSQAGSTLGGGGGGGGDVSGPGASVVGDIATWNDTTGTLLADSGVSFPIPVSAGGTGDTSLTAYAVLAGGTTSTNPVQAIASVGTSGQVLTSNGAGALPTFQASGVPSLPLSVSNGGTGRSSITLHDLVIGNGTSALTLLAPSATSGVPLISQGAASDPAFGTAVVAGGGTGAVTLTNHGVLLGQGTSAVVSTAAGSAGQVLQSGGAAADPVYSTATYPATIAQASYLYGSASNVVSALAPTTLAGGFPTYDGTNGVWFSPQAQVYEWDDFIAGENNSSFSKLSWNRVAVNGGSPSMATATQDAARPGVVNCAITTSAGSGTGLVLTNNPNGPIIFGAGRCICNFWAKTPNISDATDTYTLLIGFNSNTSGALGNNALLFSLTSGVNSGNWQMIAVKTGGATTTANSSTGTDTNWHKYTIDVNAAGTSAAFYIDGVQLANSPVITNIPVTAGAPVGPSISILRTSGSSNARSLLVDLFTIWIALTASR